MLNAIYVASTLASTRTTVFVSINSGSKLIKKETQLKVSLTLQYPFNKYFTIRRRI